MPEKPLEPTDFSLVTGGPLYRLWLRMGVLRAPLGLVHRRILVMALLAWVPLLVLSLLGGVGPDGGMLFLKGLGAHVRLLVALPILILAELPIQRRLGNMIRRLVSHEIIPAEEVPKFNTTIQRVHRVRDSVVIELGLLMIVYTLGHWIWREYWAQGRTSWYGVMGDSGWQLTLAGWWYAFVSVPLFQFIFLRWVFRIGLWFWFLWRVARLNLQLIATHPDGAGGIGMVGNSAEAFGVFLLAEGVLLAGQFAQRILFEGSSLLAYKMDIFLAVLTMVSLVLAPFLVFVPALYRAKQRGRSDYGALAHTYVAEFDAKWVRKVAPTEERFIGNADIQSLADMANSYSVVRSMRLTPFSAEVVMHLVIITVIPLLPLTLTVVPFESVINHLIKAVL
ncbi:MAG: hypothetical protein PCFJNLEI_02558 [Verrucomicrobiae bacterium]|nr:hypothetical protein [Verrucomicrobiae bacterium]